MIVVVVVRLGCIIILIDGGGIIVQESVLDVLATGDLEMSVGGAY
jgi:hypothetical protein